MQQQFSFRLQPAEAASEAAIKKLIAQAAGVNQTAVTGFYPVKKSIDARAKTIWVNLSVTAFINESFLQRQLIPFQYKDVHAAKHSVAIIGAGPAGLFAALQLIESGIKPIIIERGKDVRSRRRDLAKLNRGGVVDSDSNYCFGEGGAGTYSDGKLYTRSNKRGDIDRILNGFVHFGADEKILYESHPHIGTNKLPHIITAMREQIEQCGGTILFEKRVSGFQLSGNRIKSAITADGENIEAGDFILATGHSARDIFELLYSSNVLIESKPFALGVRVEHPQLLINNCQYKSNAQNNFLPPASYSLVQQVNERGVFSFCMCPGGIIAPAATSPGELVVNGWSPSKRNNPFANSGMVVEVKLDDAMQTLKKYKHDSNLEWFRKHNGFTQLHNHPLTLMAFQKLVEQHCFTAGGGRLVAPAQRMADFSNNKTSASLPECSYQPGLQSTALKDVLPDFVYHALAKGFMAFGKKMNGYFTNDAVVVATESRTSSPVRIPRDAQTLAHPQIVNLYPCGEGAGYAGGIVSAAMDGEKVARQIALVHQ
ncbi:MAG: FAD-dependent oxidoreductase [Bacteroidetes bacterium]|nr:FAD-dependent oxidoreductase [Bacteroidota bacterium]